jgi:uncharacterized MAPEG superfamily protein
MTIAYWCILAAIITPYVLAPIGQLPGITYEGFRAPRARWESFTGWRRRANSAHLNGFEILPGFAAAVIIAQSSAVSQGAVDVLALTFIASRLLHAAFYIGDFAILRSIAWASGLACVVALFVFAA